MFLYDSKWEYPRDGKMTHWGRPSSLLELAPPARRRFAWQDHSAASSDFWTMRHFSRRAWVRLATRGRILVCESHRQAAHPEKDGKGKLSDEEEPIRWSKVAHHIPLLVTSYAGGEPLGSAKLLSRCEAKSKI